MAVLEIRKKGDECLTKKCHAVTVFDRRLKLLLRDMRDTLIDSNGVGLAAPQVGILRRIFLVNDDGDIRVYINPQILERKGEQHPVEGCLSVPNVFGKVVRPMYVKIAALDENGEPFVKRFRAAGGVIEEYVKPDCGHHPHSLEDPSPVVEFLTKEA